MFAQITSVFGSSDNSKKIDEKDGEGKEKKEEKPETLTAVLYPHRRVRIDELVTQPPPPPPAQIVSSRDRQTQPLSTLVEEVQRNEMDKDDAEGDVASFERDVPSVEAVREELGTAPREREEDPQGEGEAREVKGEEGESRLLTVTLKKYVFHEKQFCVDHFDPFTLYHTYANARAESASPQPAPSQIGFLHPLLPSVSLTNISNLGVEPYKKDSQMVRAIMGELVSVFKDIAQLQPIFREQSE